MTTSTREDSFTFAETKGYLGQIAGYWAKAKEDGNYRLADMYQDEAWDMANWGKWSTNQRDELETFLLVEFC